jgi:hypothetical protein
LLKRANEQNIIPAAAIARRAEAMGMDRKDKRLTKIDGSSGLGILLAHGIIGRDQMEAGQMFAAAHGRLARAIGAPPGVPKVMTFGEPTGGAPLREISEEEWDRIKARYAAALAVIPGPDGGLCRKLVEAATIDETAPIMTLAPNLFAPGRHGDSMRATLREGLDALCRHYKIPLAKAVA